MIFLHVSIKLFAHETLDYILQHTMQLRPRLCSLRETARLMHGGEKAVIITATIIRTDFFPASCCRRIRAGRQRCRLPTEPPQEDLHCTVSLCEVALILASLEMKSRTKWMNLHIKVQEQEGGWRWGTCMRQESTLFQLCFNWQQSGTSSLCCLCCPCCSGLARTDPVRVRFYSSCYRLSNLTRAEFLRNLSPQSRIQMK